MKTWTVASHFFGGLAVGLAVFAVHLFGIASSLHGKPTPATGAAENAGLWWPLATVTCALICAAIRPISQLNSWVGVLGILLALCVTAPLCFVLGFLIAFSGQC